MALQRVEEDRRVVKDEVVRRLRDLGINVKLVDKGMFASSEMEVAPEVMLLLTEMAQDGIETLVSEFETRHFTASKLKASYIRNAKMGAAKWLRDHDFRVPWVTPKSQGNRP